MLLNIRQGKDQRVDPTLTHLLKRLIDLDSTTGKEASVAEFVSGYLDQMGFRVLRQSVSNGRFNVIATLGDPVAVFSSHLDTVPDFLPFSEDDRFIYGRGACDAKGIVAAQILAGKKLLGEGLGDFGFLFVVGEEDGSDGARAANALPNRCRYLIHGEPTENKLALGSKGALRLVIETQGKSAHSAYPESGESAITKLLDILQNLREMPLPVDLLLGTTTMNIGTLSGGCRANIVPDHAQSEILFRTVTDSKIVKAQVLDLIGSRATCRTEFECAPVLLERIGGFDTTVVSYTTDIPLLSNWGKPILLGPGSILDAHTSHEKVSKMELARGTDLYHRLCRRFLAGGTKTV